MTFTFEKYTDQQSQIVVFANALAHPVRVAVIQLLTSHSCCYHGHMTIELPIARSSLSQHLKFINDAGLIQGEIKSPKMK